MRFGDFRFSGSATQKRPAAEGLMMRRTSCKADCLMSEYAREYVDFRPWSQRLSGGCGLGLETSAHLCHKLVVVWKVSKFRS